MVFPFPSVPLWLHFDIVTFIDNTVAPSCTHLRNGITRSRSGGKKEDQKECVDEDEMSGKYVCQAQKKKGLNKQ